MRHARASAVALAACLAGCVQSSFNLATQKQDYTFTSVTKEVSLGRKIAEQVEKKWPPVANVELQERIRTMGEQIAAVCERQEILYHFAVIEGEEVNAFSLPGGWVYVHEGLTEKVASDDELAGVVAHEVAHIAARHSIQRYETGLGMQLAQLAAAITRTGELAAGVSVASQAAQLAYSREAEIEADRLAVKYLKDAGYDPTAMLSFLDTLHEVHRDSDRYMPRGVVRPQYAVTHPFVPERKLAVKEALYGVGDYIDYLNVQTR
ncbi:MAG TPA: M48 family metallopeptidase [bacterium]